MYVCRCKCKNNKYINEISLKEIEENMSEDCHKTVTNLKFNY